MSVAGRSRIEWTDATWNPIRARNHATGKIGHWCVHVSDGCRNCYAERMQPRFGNPVRYAAQDRDKVNIYLDWVSIGRMREWKRQRRIFVCSMTDLFLDDHDDEMLDIVFAAMAATPRHAFQVLTKRINRAREYLSAPDRLERIYAQWYGVSDAPAEVETWPLPNLWLGVSVEDQTTADARVPVLLNTPAAVRFVSYEPVLGPVDFERGGWSFLHRLKPPPGNKRGWERGLDWIICGGESGPGARPMHPDWARSVRDQCAAAGVPFFFKQWGEWVPQSQAPEILCLGGFMSRGIGHPADHDNSVFAVGKKRAGRALDGELHDAMPTVRAVEAA